MKKIHLLILLFLPVGSIAQSNYKKGYIINLKGDTVHGYIELREWLQNPKNVKFKQSLNAAGRQLGVSGIMRFEISGYVAYERYIVSISSNSTDISAPSSLADTASKTDTVFLKTIIKGKYITLYSYRDGLKERFYIKEISTDTPLELLFGVYQDDQNPDKIVTKSTFHQQLNRLVLRYCPTADILLQQVQQSAYKDADLVAITAKINGETEMKASLNSANNSAVRFFAGAAFVSGSLKCGQYYGSPTAKSSSPSITLGVDAIPNPAAGHLVFRLELGYTISNFSFYDAADPLYNIGSPYSAYIKTKLNILFITPQVIYNIYNADRIKVFVGAGFSINFLPGPASQVTSFQYGMSIPPQADEALDPKGSYSTIQLKAGVVINKRFEIYAGYFTPADVTDSFAYTSELSTYKVGLNYFFGKASH